MNFVYPGFLFALSAIAIPIIIHLFNFRRYKKVYFSDTSLLKEIQINSKSRSRIKHWLILISRILAISCIALAFAKPFIGGNNKSGITQSHKIIGIFIDNSFSMDRQLPEGYALDVAKKYAEEIAGAYASTDKFVLLTNDFEPRHQKTYSKEEFIDLVNEINISPQSRFMSEIMARQKDIMQKNKSEDATYRLFYISDFQSHVTDFDAIKPDSSMNITLIPLKIPKIENTYIDSVWFEAPEVSANVPLTIHYKVQNESENTLKDVTVRLYVNNEQKTPSSISIDAKGYAVSSFTFTAPSAGNYNCKIVIDDNSLAFDDDFYFSFNISEGIKILEIQSTESGNYFRKLFSSDAIFKYNQFSEKSIDYSTLSNQNLLVINELKSISSGLLQELKKFKDAGGSLVIVPSADVELSSFNVLLNSLGCGEMEAAVNYSAKADRINTENGFYNRVFEEIPRNMDMPSVKKYHPLKFKQNQKGDYIIKLPNGDPLLMVFKNGKGKVYLFTTPLKDSYTNLQNHALFVPTMLRIGFLSQDQAAIYYTIGKSDYIELAQNDSKDLVYKIKGVENKLEFIPEQRNVEGKTILYNSDLLNKGGNYIIEKENKPIKAVSYNYNRNESHTDVLNESDLKAKISDNQLFNFSINSADESLIKKQIAEQEEGTSLWKFFLVMGLVFLLSEILLLRFWK